MREGKAAVQKRQCTLAASYQAVQGSEPLQSRSAQEHTKNIITDDAVPKRDKPGAPGVLEARSFGFEASTVQLKCPICNNQHGYTRSNGLLKLLTQLEDWEVGYRGKTEEKQEAIFEQHGGCSICTSWKHKADKYKEEGSPSSTSLTGRSKAGAQKPGRNEAKQGTMGKVDQASANMAPNIIAIYAVMMSAPGEQVARSALVHEDPGPTHNLIIHEFADTLMLPGQAISLSLNILVPCHEERRL